MMRQPFTFAIAVIVGLGTFLAAADDQRKSTVGMPARIEQLVLPGSELEVRPLEDRKTPIVIRILNSFPHGTAYRYDLEYYGLDPGAFDLTSFLRRKDGTALGELPKVMVTIEARLPPGQIRPHELESKPGPSLGGYRRALVIGAIVWVLGFLTILFVGRRRRNSLAENLMPLTLADHLRPLIVGAVEGRLTKVELADLERTLLAFWRRRLSLEGRSPADAMATLRSHPEASPLMQELELWLHSPEAGRQIDIASLLKPYQNLPAHELTRKPIAAGQAS